MNPPATTTDRRGVVTIIAAFVMWGVVPLYWHLLKEVPSLQIIAHRIVWSAVLVVVWLLWKQGPGWWRLALARPRIAWMLALSAVLIGLNWGVYIWAVNAGHVVETSLGYFINPLVNVLLGVLLLGERLNRAQWVSVALAALSVLWLTMQYGGLPWIALTLAVTFALYALIRKLAAIDAVAGMGVESAYLLLPALAFLLWCEFNGQGGFLALAGAPVWGLWIDLLLIVGGAITALPLIGFAYGVRRIPLSQVGLLQYIAPILQLLIGVLILKEAFDAQHAIGFGGIWVALVIYAADGLRRSRHGAAPNPEDDVQTLPPQEAALAVEVCHREEHVHAEEHTREPQASVTTPAP